MILLGTVRMRTLPRCLLALVALSPVVASLTRADDSETQLEPGPETTVVTEPLTESGCPDYVEALNRVASDGVSRDENFWVLMWPAIGNVERSPDDYLRQVEERLQIGIPREPRQIGPVAYWKSRKEFTPEEIDELLAAWSTAWSRQWTRKEFPELAEWLDASEEVLADVHRALRRPKAYSPYISFDDPAMIAVRLPHVQGLRTTGRTLTARAMLRLGEGDVDGAWQDLVDVQRLARHSEHGWTLIEMLVGYAIRGEAHASVTHWLARCELPADEIEQRFQVVRPILEIESLERSVTHAERYLTLDSVCFLHRHPADAGTLLSRGPENVLWDDSRTAFPVGRPAGSWLYRLKRDSKLTDRELAKRMRQLVIRHSNVNEVLRSVNRAFDEMLRGLSQDGYQQRIEALREIERVYLRPRQTASQILKESLSRWWVGEEVPDAASILLRELTPAVRTVEGARVEAIARSATLEAAFAAAAYRARTGEFPPTIEDLGEVAIDPFTDEPLRIRTDERGFVVYSVGRDGKDGRGQGRDDEPPGDDVRAILPVAR